MDNTTLARRQRWLRSFPEGAIEFLLATRILTVLLLLATAVLREAQRPMVLIVLGLVLLADYLLMIWWVVQLAVDLEAFLGRPPDGSSTTTPEASRQQRLRAVVPACLPAAVVFVALAPWPTLAFVDPHRRAAVAHVLLPAAAVAFAVLLVFGQRALRRIRVGPPIWTALLLVPFVHWFAMHRLVQHLRGRLSAYRQARGETPVEGPAVAVAIADVTWVVALLPWIVLIAWGLPHQSESDVRGLMAPCGAILTAVFAVADVAAMEGLQRQVAATLRRMGSTSRS